MIKYPLYDFELGDKKYDLYAVVNHIGNVNSRKYNAIIKNKNDWIMCDDEKVYNINEKDIMNKNAYILFYFYKDSLLNNDL